MTQVRYELRPLKSDRPLVAFDDRQHALDWAIRRNNSHEKPVPLRLVTVETQIHETVETI